MLIAIIGAALFGLLGIALRNSKEGRKKSLTITENCDS